MEARISGRAESVFKTKVKSRKSQAEEKKNQLLKSIGQLKVENDFLKSALP